MLNIDLLIENSMNGSFGICSPTVNIDYQPLLYLNANFGQWSTSTTYLDKNFYTQISMVYIRELKIFHTKIVINGEVVDSVAICEVSWPWVLTNIMAEFEKAVFRVIDLIQSEEFSKEKKIGTLEFSPWVMEILKDRVAQAEQVVQSNCSGPMAEFLFYHGKL